jgi:hypothetical protein
MFRRFVVWGLVGILGAASVGVAEDFDVSRQCVRAAQDSYDQEYGGIELDWAQPREARLNYFLDYWNKPSLAPWLLNSAPDLRAKETASDVADWFAQQLLTDHGFSGDLTTVFRAESTAVHPYSAEALEDHREIFDRIYASPPDSAMASSREQIAQLCSVYRFPRCAEALGHVMDVMNTHVEVSGNFWLSAADRLDEVLREPIYRRVLSKVALDMIRSEDRIVGNPFRSLYSDLMNGFRAAGSSAEEAQRQTFAVLAVYGARGASLQVMGSLFHSESAPVVAAMYVIFAHLGMVDARRYAQHMTPYSLPTGVQFNCNYGRPYHFWMSAYLAWKLGQDGFDKVSSSLAVHLAGVGYEFSMNAWGKAQYRIYLDEFFNPYNVNVQLNIAQNDAGASFGARLEKGQSPFFTPLDIDAAISSEFHLARPLQEITPEDFAKAWGNPDRTQLFTWFWQVISPDAGLPVLGLSLLVPVW